MRGEPVKPSEYYMRITPVFETWVEQYGWLNRIAAVGVEQHPQPPCPTMCTQLSEGNCANLPVGLRQDCWGASWRRTALFLTQGEPNKSFQPTGSHASPD